ncbi:unnamed protein product [Sphagnum jensenii]
MPSSMTARQLLEEGSNTGTARVPRTSYFYAASLAATPAPAHPHRSSQRTAKLASFAAIMSSHDDDDPTALLPSSLLSLLPLPLASQPGLWPPPFSGTKKKMRPNSPMFSHNREGWNCAVVEFQLLLPHKGREAMGWDDLMAEKNLQAANILPANRQSCRCCRCCYRGAGDGLGS